MSKPANGETLTLSAISKAVRAKPRSVQLWADAGVIQPIRSTDRGGSGTHRRFPVTELPVAWVVARLADCGVAIGSLLRASKFARTLFGRFPTARSVSLSKLAEGTVITISVPERMFPAPDPLDILKYNGAFYPGQFAYLPRAERAALK